MSTIPERIGSQNAVLDKLKESIFADLHVATIGIVTAVDGNLLTAKPAINERIVTNGVIQWQGYPEIPDVPFLQIGNSPQIGDPVLLIFCDHDLSGWLQNGGMNASGTPTPQNQEVLQYHALSNAVAITGFGQNPNIDSSTSYGKITGSTANDGSGVSEALVQFIESYEGKVDHPYQDSTGTWTIGYGHTFTPPWTGPNPMTDQEMEDLLKSDLSSRIASVQEQFSDYPLTQNQFDALVDFVFNLGAGALQNSDLKEDIKAGATSSTLKVDFEQYCHAGGKVLSGLVHRRDAEWAMFCNGQYLGNG